MRKPRSSNRVSGSHRFSAIVFSRLSPRTVRKTDPGPMNRSSIWNARIDGYRLSLRSAGMTSYVQMPPKAFTSVFDGLWPGMTEFGLSPLPAQVLTDRDALGLERLAQHRHASVRIGAAAHEDVDRGVMHLRPSVDRDVALGEHRDARNPAVGLEVMQV